MPLRKPPDSPQIQTKLPDVESQMRMSFSIVPWKYALLMSICKDFSLFDKLTDIMIDTSTLLIESADSSVSCIGTVS